MRLYEALRACFVGRVVVCVVACFMRIILVAFAAGPVVLDHVGGGLDHVGASSYMVV